MHLCRIIFFLSTLLALAGLPLSAQDSGQKDSLVVLLSAQSAQTVDLEGGRYRKIIGPARFLHNNTYLICDTAFWNVETRVIDAWGNVSILQEETVLKGDKLTYLIDSDLAQFRGSVVQLEDKDHNMLRTRHLDYNTKDSVAVFRNGGAMRDKDGQIIESINGTYESKVKTFTFEQDVNMFTDSVFVKTGKLKYQSDKNMAHFFFGTDAWKDDDMLSSSDGWYDRSRELFLFNRNVHVLSTDQEGWCDSLYFNRLTSDVEMLGNAQVSDTTRNVYALAGRIEYQDSLSKVTMTRSPAVISRTENNEGVLDTVYVGAEKLVYQTISKCDIDSSLVEDAKQRLKNLDVDPVGTFRKKAAEEAAKAAEEQAKNDPNYRPAAQKPKSRPESRPESKAVPAADTLAVKGTSDRADSLGVADSLGTVDSLVAPIPKDSTKIGFLSALKKVRIFRKDLQVVCDSLLYSDLDSLARLFVEPIVWQEGTRQYSADSITIVIRNNAMEKANLMSNSFITIQEDSIHFDQIKGAEMLAFFDSKGELERFDVLGGASAVFFLEENECLATVNKSESKMISASFSNGEIQRVYYFDEVKNDGYPVVQMTQDEQRLKGFVWYPERRPKDRNDITTLSLRPSQRKSYKSRPRAKFTQTDIYFPGYMKDVYKRIHIRDSINAIRQREREMIAAADTVKTMPQVDSIPSSALVDSLAQQPELQQPDSLSSVTPLPQDSSFVLTELPDTTINKEEKLSKAEKKALKKKEAEKKQAAKQKALEEKWKRLDERDAARAKARQEKKLQKLRKKKRKAYLDYLEQTRKDAELLEKYIEKYRGKKSSGVSARKAKKDGEDGQNSQGERIVEVRND